MKRIVQYLGLIALTLAFTSCSPSKTKGVIAYTPLTLSNPFFKIIGDHITAEAAKNGYDTLMVDPDMDVKKQSDQFDDFISSGVTAIILVPCDRLSIGPAVKLANAKGIPVFTVDAKCAAEGAEIAGHVGTDNFQGGELAGQAMIKALGENGGKVLILDFKKAHSCVLRVAGFKKVIDAHNAGHTTGKIEIVAELNGNGARSTTRQRWAPTPPSRRPRNRIKSKSLVSTANSTANRASRMAKFSPTPSSIRTRWGSRLSRTS